MTDTSGFLHSSDEYKVMALASYGKPRVSWMSSASIVRLGGEGSIRSPPDLDELFGPARARGAPLEQRHYDIASSLQVALGGNRLELADWLHARAAKKNSAWRAAWRSTA